MKTGSTLQGMLTQLQEQNKMKRDFICPAQGMRLRDDGRTFEINHLSTGQQEVFDTTQLFYRQLIGVAGVPANYADRMLKEKPELLARNINEWMGDKETSYMVRSFDYGLSGISGNGTGTTGNRVARALVSERYRRIDNWDVASAVLPMIADAGDYSVESCEVTENRMYIKVTTQRLQAEIKVGDVVQAGLVISNSEVGLGSVSVQPMLLRLVCSNGMIVNDFGQRKHHTGRQLRAVEDSFDLYSDETLEADDKAFLLKLRDITLAAVEETRFQKIVDTLRTAAGVPISGRVQDVVELTGKSYGMNQDEQDGVLRYLIEGGDLSMYGLSNAVTRMSQDVPNYDRATALESIGWQVAAMPAEQWREMNR